MGGFGMGKVVEQLADLKLGELLDSPPPGFDEAVAISKVCVLHCFMASLPRVLFVLLSLSLACSCVLPAPVCLPLLPALPDACMLRAACPAGTFAAGRLHFIASTCVPLLEALHMPAQKNICAQVLQFVKGEEYARFTRIVFDTAPTGHTLRLLTVPDFVDASLDKIIRLRKKLGGASQVRR
jgi:hypothetical protein